MKVILVTFSCFLFSICHATDIEKYFGSYRVESTNKDNIQFTFDIDGIKGLMIEGKSIKSGITYDLLGIFGSTLFLRIEIEGNDDEFGIINILILKEKEFIVSSGFYIWAKSLSSGEYQVRRKFPFSLNYKSLD